MNNYKFLIAIFILVITLSCSKKEIPKEENPLSGLWSLYIMEQMNPETEEWQEWRKGMQGYILYDENNNMSLHITTAGYEKTGIQFANFTDTISEAALKHLTNSYVYFAKYKVNKEEGIVEHARISHSNPSSWNEVVERRYTFIGDTLILQPVEKGKSGLRLKWIKDTN